MCATIDRNPDVALKQIVAGPTCTARHTGTAMRIGNRDIRVKTGLTIFLAVSVASALVIFFIGAKPGTWTRIREIRLQYTLLAASFMLSHWCLNALRFKILVNSLGNRVGFLTSLKAFIANVFVSAVTPSQTGGGPIQIYILNRAGVPLAKGFTGCLMGAVMTVFCLLASAIAILVAKPDLRRDFGHHLTGVVASVVIVFGTLAILFLLSLFRINLVKNFVGRTLLTVLRVIRTERRLALTKQVLGGLDQYRECMSVFFKVRKLRLLLALALTMASLAASSAISLALLAGLNVEFDLLNVYLAQFILFFIAYFGPTPGSSGIAEFSTFWVLSSLRIRPEVLGVYVVMWRFLTSFVAVAVGGIITLNLIRRPGKPVKTDIERPAGVLA
jgi:uncharacterized protein (TIRG00374 family)